MRLPVVHMQNIMIRCTHRGRDRPRWLNRIMHCNPVGAIPCGCPDCAVYNDHVLIGE